MNILVTLKGYMKYSVGVIGGGFVGSAIKNYYKEAVVYDKFKDSDSLESVLKCDYIFVAVPTPYNEHGFDKSALEDAFESIASNVSDKVVIIKSTVEPGTTDYFQKKYPNLKIVFNPEFLTEVTGDQDFSYPDRQIVGFTEQSFAIAQDMLTILPLAPFERIIPAKAAEVVKYFNNTWFATKVTFANQIFDLCEKIGVDYDIVKESASADRRMTGTSHLEVKHKGYRGYGGKCFPKDVRALIDFGDENGVNMSLLKQVEEINNTLRQGQDRTGE